LHAWEQAKAKEVMIWGLMREMHTKGNLWEKRKYEYIHILLTN